MPTPGGQFHVNWVPWDPAKRLEHDAEKCGAVFGQHHASSLSTQKAVAKRPAYASLPLPEPSEVPRLRGSIMLYLLALL
ncbi:hypothetical protein, partial [Mesorhizobium sp. M8A.F.Ca.ET.167.01.1.1]|uniref:hypothetical protein n=1 Tax=Mesorhizobium sp. M8A.F.Ca.ET.167.01.1.1 TaxID=2563961 RepID=UPI001AEE7E82